MNLAGIIQLHASGHLDAAEQGYRSLIGQKIHGSVELRNLALICTNDGRVDEAIELYKSAIELNQSDLDAWIELGCTYWQIRDAERALDSWTRARELNPESPIAHMNIGVVHGELGNLDLAAASYQSALRCKADFPEAWYNLGNTYMAQHKLDLAIDCYQRAIEFRPDFAKAYLNMGNAYRLEPDQAIACFREAVRIAPDFVDAYLNLGNTLVQLGRAEEALATLQKAVELSPQHAPTYNNLGLAYLELGRVDESSRAFRKALELEPDYSKAHTNMALALRDGGDLKGAIAALQKSLEIDDNHPQTYEILGLILSTYGKSEEANAAYRKSFLTECEIVGASAAVKRLVELLIELERIPVLYREVEEIAQVRSRYSASLEEALSLVSNDQLVIRPEDREILVRLLFKISTFYLSYQQFNDVELQSGYSRLITSILRPEPYKRDASFRGGSKVRLGIASEYLRNHVASFWGHGWPAALPREDYELFFYSLNGKVDDVTEKCAAIGTFRWLPFHPVSYTKSLEVMKNDNLDVLFIPDVGMTATSKILSVHRVAPVQAVAWAHPITTGSPAIDYFLTSDMMEPEGAEQHYSEKLVKLPKLGVCFPAVSPPSESFSRADFDLPKNKVVFGSVQSLFKYLPQYDSVFASIAKRVPNSYFVFVAGMSDPITAVFEERLRRAFAEAGLDFDQYGKVLPRMEHLRFLKLLGVIDVNLDSIGWTGGITTMYSFSMNCPVVTYAGEFMRGRHSYAMLKMVGAEELIAGTLDEYVEIAVKLGSDKKLRKTLSKRIADNKGKIFNERENVEQLDAFFKSQVVRERQPEPPAAVQPASDDYQSGVSHFRNGKVEQAIECFRRVLAEQPESAHIHNDLGIALFHHGLVDEAVMHLNNAVRINPDYPEAYLNLGVIKCAAGCLDDGIASYQRALVLNPAFADAHYNLALAYGNQCRFEEALSCYSKAIEINPKYLNAYLNSGNILVAQNKPAEALEVFRRAIEIDESYAALYLSMSVALSHLGRLDESIESCNKVLQLIPDSVEAYNNLGRAYSAQGRWDDAIAVLRRAIEINPQYVGAYANLGIAFQGAQRLDEAVATFARAVELAPQEAQNHNNLGAALQRQKKLDHAVSAFSRALELKDDDVDALNNLALVLMEQNKVDEAVGVYHHALEVRTRGLAEQSPVRAIGRLIVELHRVPVMYHSEEEVASTRQRYLANLTQCLTLLDQSAPTLTADEYTILKELVFKITNFYLAYQQLNDRDVQAAYAKLLIEILKPEMSQFLRLERAPNTRSKIRLGIVSEYLQSHNASFWAYGWLDNFPKSDYEFFLYSLNGNADSYTERFANLGAFRWLKFDKDSYVRALEEIRKDELDILFFPDVGMSVSSKIASLCRLAPIQCVGWGHPVTTGSPNVDYYLSGEFMETEQSDSYYSEKLVRLPNVGLYLEPPELPAERLTRADFGIPDGKVIYGAVQSLFKYLPQYDHVYTDIAKKVENAVFVFVGSNSPEVAAVLEARLRSAFEQASLSFEKHVKILNRMPFSKFMQLISIVDVSLDSVGFNGGTTAMRCLYVNCPVVTLAGPTMRERAGAAMLQMAGLNELVADSVENYVSLSSKLGLDDAYRLSIVSQIEERKERLFYDRQCVDSLDQFFKSKVKDTRKAIALSPA